jgi:hypothetical protein
MTDPIGKLIGRQVRFYASNYPTRCFRHRNGELWLDEYASSDPLMKLDSSFLVVPGLCGTGISFQSRNYPDSFVRHYDNKGYVSQFANDPVYKKDASWVPEAGLAGTDYYSFGSVNYPGMYLRHFNSRLCLGRNDGSDILVRDASWKAEVLADVATSGTWKLVYGNDNADSAWTWTEKVTIGVKLSSSESTEEVQQYAWKASQSGSGSAFGLAVKAVFEESGMSSVKKISASAWESTHLDERTQSKSGAKGQPFYLWQWCLICVNSDGTKVEVATDLYRETATSQAPTETP